MNIFPKFGSFGDCANPEDLISKPNNNLLKENKYLREELESIEEDGTEEHNEALKLRQENAQLKVDNENWKKGVITWRTQYDQEVARNSKLEDEIKELKNWSKTLTERESQMYKEVKNLRHLKQENVDLMEMLAKYRDGYQGSCYACEPVGELNQKLELQIKALHKIIDGAKETIDKLKKDLQDVKNENNSLKIFPPKDCGDVRLQKHPIYPIHWGGYSVDTTWEQATSDLALRVVKLEKQVEELKLINSQVNINKKS